MTDRIKGVWVAFDRDIREDDAEATINAIRRIKGVVAVDADVSDSRDWMARQRVRSEWAREILATVDRLAKDKGGD